MNSWKIAKRCGYHQKQGSTHTKDEIGRFWNAEMPAKTEVFDKLTIVVFNLIDGKKLLKQKKQLQVDSVMKLHLTWALNESSDKLSSSGEIHCFFYILVSAHIVCCFLYPLEADMYMNKTNSGRFLGRFFPRFWFAFPQSCYQMFFNSSIMLMSWLLDVLGQNPCAVEQQ